MPHSDQHNFFFPKVFPLRILKTFKNSTQVRILVRTQVVTTARLAYHFRSQEILFLLTLSVPEARIVLVP